MTYQEGLKRMIDQQIEHGKKEEEQQRNEVIGLFGGSRLHLVISGTVQGVGFRAFVKQQAEKLKLVGWVKNTAEGVELVAEGAKESLEKFLSLCLKGSLGAHVHKHETQWETATGEFSTFKIQQ